MNMQTFTLINTSVATSFSGGIYYDVPANGTLTHVAMSVSGLAAAANPSEAIAELGTATVDQYASGTGKNILATCAVGEESGNMATANVVVPLGLKVQAGQRFYLNFKNGQTNWQACKSIATLFLQS